MRSGVNTCGVWTLKASTVLLLLVACACDGRRAPSRRDIRHARDEAEAAPYQSAVDEGLGAASRSEERRVGKEWRATTGPSTSWRRRRSKRCWTRPTRSSPNVLIFPSRSASTASRAAFGGSDRSSACVGILFDRLARSIHRADLSSTINVAISTMRDCHANVGTFAARNLCVWACDLG